MSLHLKALEVCVGELQVLKGITAEFPLGTTTCIIGKNGSGKSSLAMTVMGHPKYRVTGWDILLDGTSLAQTSPTERAHLGIFLALQNIPEIPGIKLSEYLRTIYNEHLKRTQPEVKPLTPFVFKRFVVPLFVKFWLAPEFLERDLNVGFSGWEKRRLEMLQIELLNPKYILVDEIDAWLDKNALETVTESLNSLATSERAIIVITHNYSLACSVRPSRVLLIESGKIQQSGWFELLESIAPSSPSPSLWLN
jgi:Fe-S cluster assembly ATP-binding protein